MKIETRQKATQWTLCYVQYSTYTSYDLFYPLTPYPWQMTSGLFPFFSPCIHSPRAIIKRLDEISGVIICVYTFAYLLVLEAYSTNGLLYPHNLPSSHLFSPFTPSLPLFLFSVRRLLCIVSVFNLYLPIYHAISSSYFPPYLLICHNPTDFAWPHIPLFSLSGSFSLPHLSH